MLGIVEEMEIPRRQKRTMTGKKQQDVEALGTEEGLALDQARKRRIIGTPNPSAREDGLNIINKYKEDKCMHGLFSLVTIQQLNVLILGTVGLSYI